MKVLSKKEGGFYNNKILVVSVLMLMLIGVLFMVYGSADSAPTVTFNTPSANNSFVADSTPLINITFTATNSASANVTIINSSINITINNIVYKFSNMTCQYPTGALNESITCNVSTQPLTNGTYNITAKALDNASGSIIAILQNYTIYTGAPSVFSVNLSDSDPVKAGNVTFNVTFDRIMDTSFNPTVKLRLANGSEIGISGVGTGYNNTYGMTTLHNLSFTNDTTNRRSTWSGYFIFNTSVEISSIFDGNTIINITGARDTVSNVMAEDSSNTFVLDTTNPLVSLETLNGTNQSSVALLYNFTDNLSVTSTCKLYLNSTFNKTENLVANTTGRSISITDSNAEGAFKWIVECTDLAGNVANASGWYIVNVDKTPPFITASLSSPLGGHYIKDTGDVRLSVNITDSFTGIRNVTTYINMSVQNALGAGTTWFTTSSSTPLVVTGNTLANRKLEINISKYFSGSTLADYNVGAITYTAYTKDFAGNLQSNSTTFYIDNTNPVLGTPELNADSYVQSTNLTLTLTVTEAGAGLNKTNASLGINTTTYTSLGNVDLTCTGTKPDYTCTYTYNTSNLEAGSLRLNGTITAYDNTDGLANSASNSTVALDFIITDSGLPTLESITSNVTRIVKDLSIDVQINVSVNDTGGVNTVWATYTDNSSTSETCTFFSGGGVTDTSLVAIGNCSFLANSSGIGTDGILTLTLRANDTTGTLATTSTLDIIVENEAINVSAFTAPSSPYVNQTITINTTVFSWYGSPSVWFNATNSTSTKGVISSADCTSLDAKASLYYCNSTFNTSTLQIFAGNESTISVLNATYSYTANDTSLPSALTSTFYASRTVTIDTAPSTSTIKFVESDVSVAGGTAQSTVIGSTVQDIQITDTTLSDTTITLNEINLTAMTNFTFEIVVANATNGTNYTTIQSSLTTGTATLLTALVIQPKINNVSTATYFTGSTIAFNCSALGITCAATTRVYKREFNTTTNLTIGSTWTKLTAPTLSDSNTILTQTVNSFSIFALATPYVAAAEESSSSTTSPSRRSPGGIGYLLAGKLTAFDIIDMIRDFYEGTSTKTAFDIIDSIREFYEEGS